MRHLMLAVVLLMVACSQSSLKVDVPIDNPAQIARVVVIYEHEHTDWHPPLVVPPPVTVHETCGIYILPVFPQTPELPKVGPRGRSEDEDQIVDNALYGQISDLRHYIINFKKQLKQSHDDYLESCTKVSTYRPD